MAIERRTEIQWLRAVAACEVAICHSDLLTKHFSGFAIAHSVYRPFSALGVELFFIVSGYVICMKVKATDGGWPFFAARIRRLYPMYAIFTTIAVLAFVVNPNWHLNQFEMGIGPLARSYLILPQMGFPVLGVGWTLEHEMIFYLFVAGMLLTIGGGSQAKLLLAWLLAALGAVGIVWGGMPDPSMPGAPGAGHLAVVSHVFSPFMFAFGLGWLMREIEGWKPKAQFWSALPFAALFAVAAWFAPSWGHWPISRLAVAAVIFIAFLLCRRAFADNAINRWVWKLGDASFSIYLSHWFVLSALGKLCGAMNLSGSLDVPVRILGVAISVAIGVGVYRLIEKPLDRLLREKPATPTAPAVSRPRQHAQPVSPPQRV